MFFEFLHIKSHKRFNEETQISLQSSQNSNRDAKKTAKNNIKYKSKKPQADYFFQAGSPNLCVLL